MDREIPIGNRVIEKKMKQFYQKKHRQTLNSIKKKTTYNNSLSSIQTKHHRFNSAFVQSRNLQIERKNIKLFNKIASIIREKPNKNNIYGRSYARSFEDAQKSRRKQQQRLKTENELYQKRLQNQRSTIKNNQFYQDRRKNQRYLKFIGRYPYIPLNQRLQTQQSKVRELDNQNNSFQSRQIYRKLTDEYFVRITKISFNQFQFVVQKLNNKRGSIRKEFQFIMDKNTYAQQLQRCSYNYDQLISKLRLSQKNQMIFDYS